MRASLLLTLMTSALAILPACEKARQYPATAAGNDTSRTNVNRTPKRNQPAGSQEISSEITRTALDAKARELRERLDDTFIVKVHSPFVVAGNLPQSRFDRFLQHTILGSYGAFYRDFFEKRPDRIITIYLFRENLSYRKWASELFGDTEVSHFGYYKPGEHALVMNIGTGGGTLVHEMTHAFMHFDFPRCPAWFNEGMGSLFEACAYHDGHIRGLMNWRFPILKRGLGNQRYTPMHKLVATSSSDFYKDPFGMHYAQARYFCMYLQQKDLLRRFYKAFRDNYKQDNTGRKQLEQVTGESLEDLESAWLEWAKKLKYKER